MGNEQLGERLFRLKIEEIVFSMAALQLKYEDCVFFRTLPPLSVARLYLLQPIVERVDPPSH